MDFFLEPITIQQILVFLQVAESEGFQKASNQLHMTQSAVSKSIAKLEKELDLRLFIRTTRQLQLTQAGQLLYDSWKEQIRLMNETYIRAMTLQQEELRVLRIGILNTARPESYFWKIEQSFRKQYPDVKLDLTSDYMTTLEEQLAEGRYDAVMVPDFEHYTIENLKLNWHWAARSNVLAIVPVTNPLCKCTSLTMEDLLSQKLVSLSDAHSSDYLLDLKKRFAEYGVDPNISVHYKSAFDIRLFYNMNDAILLVDNFFDFHLREGLVEIPVLDQYNGIICAYSPSNTNPYLKNFLELLPEA